METHAHCPLPIANCSCLIRAGAIHQIHESLIRDRQKMTAKSSFCSCFVDKESIQCNCGEELKDFEWAFEEPSIEVAVKLTNNRREAKFHSTVSAGTVGLRGDEPLVPGRHYLWEIKMLNPVYGTDVMVGVGTSKVDLNEHCFEFKSLLGKTNESWGFSYRGRILHNGRWEDYGCSFGKGSIIGVHLDLWSGLLEFYVNRKYMGVAFHLKPQVLYPMVSSTAGNSAMRLIGCASWANSLQFECLRSMSLLPTLVEQVISVPGLRSTWAGTLWWLFLKGRTPKQVESAGEAETETEDRTQRKSKIILDLSSSEDSDDAYIKWYRSSRKNAGRKRKGKLPRKWAI